MDVSTDHERDSGLFGRAAELREVRRLVDPGEPGGGALLIRGDPGIGKTAILDWARALAEAQGLQRLETSGAQTETELAFAGLQRLLSPILPDTQRLPDRQRSAVLSAVGAVDGSAPDLFLIALGALNLITDAAVHRRLLVVVDDAQWLDHGSAHVLTFIARRLKEEPVGMLVAIRGGYASPLLDARLDELRLQPLQDAAANQLLDSRSPQLGAADRRTVLAEAGGNPLALIEFGARGTDRPADQDGQLPGRLPLTERLERAFALRAEDLPMVTRAALLVAATDDRDLLSEVLAATSEYLGVRVGEDALTEAVEARLVALDGIRIVFPNPLVRSAIYQAASDEQRRGSHSALALTLNDDPDRIVWHRALAASAPDELVASELEAASGRAERRGAIATAVNSLERAAALSEDSERRVNRLLRGADLAVEMGRADLVGRMLSELGSQELTPLSSARAAWIRDRFDDRAPGDTTRILALVEDARRSAVARETDLALELLLAAAWRTWWAVTDSAVRERVVLAADTIAVDPSDPRLLAVLAVAGPVENAAIVSERLTGTIITPDDDATAACLRGLAAHAVGQSGLAVQILAEAAVTMRAQGRLGLLARVLGMQAWSTIQLGDWSNVAVMANEATGLSRETDQPLWAAGAQAAEAAAAGVRGDLARAEALGVEVEHTALPARLSNVLCVLQIARGITALGAGRYADAYESLSRVFDPADPAYHFAERHGALGYLVEAAVRTGHHGHARALVEEIEAVALRTPARIVQLGLLYARPLVGTADIAESGFRAALEADAARTPFFRARVQLAYGEWLRRQRRVIDSRIALRRARDAFEAIGARPWGERAREQLRASGESSNDPVAVAIDELTPQQRQIAQLAAAGLTNREIGEQLFLSPRTVASHLYRLFPKLGVTSRAELSHAMTRSDHASAPENPHDS